MAPLSGDQRRELHQALLSAFPRLDQLDQLISYGLNDNLQRIAGRENLDVTITKIIEATEATGKTKALLQAAIRQNPDNEFLRSVVERLNATLESDQTGATGPIQHRRALALFVRGFFLSAAVLILVGLAMLRPPGTFELSLTLDRLSVEVDNWGENETQSLFEPVGMILQIAGFSKLELGAGLLTRGLAAQGQTVPTHAPLVTLTPGGPVTRVRFDNGTLRSLHLGGSARLTLEYREESPQRHALWVAFSDSKDASGGTIEIPARATFECSSCATVIGTDLQEHRVVGAWTFHSNGPHLARFHGPAPQLTMWPEPGTVLEDRGILLKDDQNISIFRLENDRPRSAIIERGSIGFPSLWDTIPIVTGDFVEIDDLRSASISSLRIESGIQVRIAGVAGSLRVGNNPSELLERRPMLFRYLVASKDRTFVYAGMAVVGAILLALIRQVVNRRV